MTLSLKSLTRRVTLFNAGNFARKDVNDSLVHANENEISSSVDADLELAITRSIASTIERRIVKQRAGRYLQCFQLARIYNSAKVR
jgi:hypothetical protein